MLKRSVWVVMFIIGSLFIVLPVSAGTYAITITGMGGICANFTTDYNQNIAGTIDDGGGIDRFGVVIYDREGTAIAWRPAAIANGGNNMTPQNAITWNHVAVAQSRPFTLKTFDTTIDVTGVADAEGGIELTSVDFDPATFGVCGALPVGPLSAPITPPTTNQPSTTPSSVLTDSRLNPNHGDLTAVIYADTGSNGEPALNIYCVIDNGGVFARQVTEETITEGIATDDCTVRVYQLLDGAIQINITTIENKRYEIICSDFICPVPVLTMFDPSA